MANTPERQDQARYGEREDSSKPLSAEPNKEPTHGGTEGYEDLGQDGAGQKTSVGQPYESDDPRKRVAHRGVEKELHRDHD